MYKDGLILLSEITECLSKIGYVNNYFTTFFPKEKKFCSLHIKSK